MTPTEKRNHEDERAAKRLYTAAHNLYLEIDAVKQRGLTVDCNVGTRYSRSIGGYVNVRRDMKNKTLKVLECDLFVRPKTNE